MRQSREVLEQLLPGTTELLGAVLVSIGTVFAVPSSDRGLHLDVAISLVEAVDEISSHLPELHGTVKRLR